MAAEEEPGRGLRLEVLGWLQSFPGQGRGTAGAARVGRGNLLSQFRGNFSILQSSKQSQAGFLVGARLDCCWCQTGLLLGARQNQSWILACSALPGQVWVPQSWCSPSEIPPPGLCQGLLPSALFGYEIQRILTHS